MKPSKLKIVFIIENRWESSLMLTVAEQWVLPRRRISEIYLTDEQAESLDLRQVGISDNYPVYEEIIDVFIDHSDCKYIPCGGEEAVFDCKMTDQIVLSFIIANTWASSVTYQNWGYSIRPACRVVKINLNDEQKSELRLRRVGTHKGEPVYEVIADCFVQIDENLQS